MGVDYMQRKGWTGKKPTPKYRMNALKAHRRPVSDQATPVVDNVLTRGKTV